MVERGKFITFEGGEGAGKTTQIQLLRKALEDAGTPVVQTREPGGTEGAELVRQMVLAPRDRDLWDGVSEALLMYAGRHDLVRKVIRPALEQGSWVLSDRFFDSTYAFQGWGQGVGGERIQSLQHWVLGEFEPDLTFYLDLAPQEGLMRAHTRRGNAQADRMEARDEAFHSRVRDGFLHLARISPRVVCLNGSDSIDALHQQIWDTVMTRCGEQA